MSAILESNLMWLAGLVDGEGCLSIRRYRRKSQERPLQYNFQIQLSMSHRPTIMHIKDIVGMGHVGVYNKKKAAEGQRIQWYWACYGGDAREILSALYPYLITKKEEAAVAFEFFELVAKVGGNTSDATYLKKGELYQEMQRLKWINWEIAP